MKGKLIGLTSSFVFALLLAACSSAPSPAVTAAPTRVSSMAPPPTSSTRQPALTPTQPSSTATAAPSATANAKPPAPGFETKTNSGGSVTVGVKPLTLQGGQPIAFDIGMNTHSVDLSDDLTMITILRDDAGKEYKPIAWEGAGPGGHHRAGTLKFAALTSKPKYVELVIKGLATIPERVFRWDLS